MRVSESCARSAIDLGVLDPAPRSRCTDAAPQRCECPSSGRRSHPPLAPHPGRPGDRRHNSAGHHARHRHPRPREPAGAAYHPATPHRRARRSSSSSPAAARPATPAGTTRLADAVRPALNGTRSAQPVRRNYAANDQGLRYGTQPPRDRLESTQPEIINRWLRYIPDRHTATSRTTAGVLVARIRWSLRGVRCYERPCDAPR